MNLNQRDILLDVESLRPSSEILRVIGAIFERYPSIDAMCPSFAFRHFVEAYLPNLQELANAIRDRLENGRQAVLVRSLGLPDLDRHVAEFLLLALSACIGVPTTASPTNEKIIWEVSLRCDLPYSHVPTISETNSEADLHTDSAYRVQPERYVALLCLHPAEDGGGLTQLLDTGSILSVLRSTPDGARCERILRERKFPFRVPDSFTSFDNIAISEIVTAPVFAQGPVIRYRGDSIAEGFEVARIENSQEMLWALRTFRDAMERCECSTFGLNRGDLIFTNNHTVLHGRTAFIDPNRLLLRVRMNEDSAIESLDV